MLVLSIIGVIVLVIGAIFFFIDYAKDRKKKMSYSIMIIGIFLGAGGYLRHSYQVHQEEVLQAQTEEDEENNLARIKQDKEEKFSDAYKNTTYYVYDVGTNAGDVGTKLMEVWHDAIWKDGVTIDGKNYTDVNEAVNAQYKLHQSDGTIDKLNSSLDNMESAYKKLKNNATNKNTDKLNTAEKNVKNARKLAKVVKNPSGNYTTFSNKVNDAVSALTDDIEDK